MSGNMYPCAFDSINVKISYKIDFRRVNPAFLYFRVTTSRRSHDQSSAEAALFQALCPGCGKLLNDLQFLTSALDSYAALTNTVLWHGMNKFYLILSCS